VLHVPRPDAALSLVDWRRRVAALYAAVRAEAEPAAGHELWVRGRDELFGRHPDSPLPVGDPLRTTGLPVWPYDPAWRFEVPLEPASPAAGGAGDDAGRTVDLAADGVLGMVRIGTVDVPDPAGGVLDVWWLNQYGGGIFLPVRDATAGTTSYGAGRYLLDTAKNADLGTRDGRLVLDFNFLYHPSCRYDPAWTCPLAPAGNRLTSAAEVGERLP
jgi:uncharacterized protein (DUF1684 family)